MTNQAELLAEESEAAYVYEEPIVTYVYEEPSPEVGKMVKDALKRLEEYRARKRKEAGAVLGQK